MNIVFLRFLGYPPPQYDTLADCQRARGHTVWVGTLTQDAKFEWHDGRDVLAVQAGPAQVPDWLCRRPVLASVFRRTAFLRFILSVRKFLRTASPDIVQVNPTCMYWAWLLPLFMPDHIQFVLDFCELLQRSETNLIGKFRSTLDHWTWQICARYFYHRICFVNAAGARKILGAGWPQTASVIPVGIGEGFLDCQLPALDRTPDDEPVQFIYLGVISRVRQLEKLLVAIQMVQERTNRIRVAFIGPDATEGFYHRMVEQLGLGSIVAIKPPLPYVNVPAAAARYHVALAYVPEVPADWQYYPTLKVQEYRALGLPIVASDFEPNHQFVQHNVNGLLVPNTAEAWAEAMTTFVVDRNFLHGCQTRARQMRQGRTWDEIARIWEQEIYDQLTAGELSSSTTAYTVASE